MSEDMSSGGKSFDKPTVVPLPEIHFTEFKKIWLQKTPRKVPIPPFGDCISGTFQNTEPCFNFIKKDMPQLLNDKQKTARALKKMTLDGVRSSKNKIKMDSNLLTLVFAMQDTDFIEFSNMNNNTFLTF